MSFCVEASNDPHTGNACPVEKYFDRLDDAYSFIETCQLKAIWLSEEGQRVEGDDSEWFYFWWNESVRRNADWPRPEGSGRGYPASDLRYIIDYQPLDATE